MARDDFTLTPEELRNRQGRRRRRRLFAFGLVVILAVAIVLAKPIRNAVLTWQARRHAARALVFMDQEKWRDARDESYAAYRLQPNEPAALRAVARLLTRGGQGEALQFWKNLGTVSPLTPSDLREEAAIAMKTNDLGAASEAVRRLLENAKEKPTAADWLLAADIWILKREYDKATQFAGNALADTRATRREQLQSILVLEEVIRNTRAAFVGNTGNVDNRLAGLATGDDDVALDALNAVAQHALAPAGRGNNPPPMPVDELIRRINAHPLAKAGHKLLAADLETLQEPGRRVEIEQREIDRWKNSGNEDLMALTKWLDSHGEYQLALNAIPLERAMQARELFLQHVNTLCALGRWKDIQKLLESERYPLDPVMQNMYLARCNAEQGQPLRADDNWELAIQNSAGDLNRLLSLGDFAEKNGAEKIAATAYDAAAAVSPKSRAAQLGRLRVAYASTETTKIHALLENLLKIWPNDTGLENDEAYTRLLLLPADTKPDASQLKSVEAIAQKLVQEEPSNLAHRTVLGLVLLKENRPYTALSAYSGLHISPQELSLPAVVVYSAVLAATGRDADARAAVVHLARDKILPEERALIKSL
jgi:hypothetical protein